MVGEPPGVAGDRPLRLLPRWAAIAALLSLAAALAWSSWAVPNLARADAAHEATAHAATAIGDFQLYSFINARVAAGEDYYAAAMTVQRLHDYPTRPFVTVRLPTLAWVNAALGQTGTYVVALLLLAANIAAWWLRWGRGLSLPERVAMLLCLLVGGLFTFEPRSGTSHELVAGLLLSLSLAVMSRKNWLLSLLLAALALAVRELALPFLLLWLVFAAVERQWRRAAAIAAIIALFLAGLWWHAEAVAAQALPGDRPSPGWTGMAGPQMALYALSRLTGLMLTPLWLAAPLALLPLVGWLNQGGRTALFAMLWFAGFFVLLALFARPANFYWVLLVLPAYAAGLALAPRAVGDLLEAALRGPQSRF